jgi:hypothetical protein
MRSLGQLDDQGWFSPPELVQIDVSECGRKSRFWREEIGIAMESTPHEWANLTERQTPKLA